LCTVGSRYPKRNRYCNIVPFDDWLVECSGGYVNASKVSPLGQKFIVSQAPLGPATQAHEDTRAQFWRLVYENQIHTIVSLTPLGGRECADYVSDQHIPGVSLTVVSQQDTEKCYHITRRLRVVFDNSKSPEFLVNHILFAAWPNYGTPDNPQAVADVALALIRARKENGQRTLVHCSGGVGRSGTFVAAVSVYERLVEFAQERDLTGLDFAEVVISLVKQAVETMRDQRHPWMVEGADQYAFIHDILVHLISVPDDLSLER
jgi:protein tyrosine phosphatase